MLLGAFFSPSTLWLYCCLLLKLVLLKDLLWIDARGSDAHPAEAGTRADEMLSLSTTGVGCTAAPSALLGRPAAEPQPPVLPLTVLLALLATVAAAYPLPPPPRLLLLTAPFAACMLRLATPLLPLLVLLRLLPVRWGVMWTVTQAPVEVSGARGLEVELLLVVVDGGTKKEEAFLVSAAGARA
jgi:hypothetical protein